MQITCGYSDVFINCLDLAAPIHSRGSIGEASDIMLHFSKSVLMKKQTHLHNGWSEGE